MIICKRLSETAKLPTSSYDGDAGYDLYSDESLVIRPGQTARIRTGIVVAQPEGYWLKFFDRSSMAAKSMLVMGGVIDQYRGEIVVLLHNLRQGNDEDIYIVEQGDKIAQFVLYKLEKMPLIEGEPPESKRGKSGFGSTGK